MKSCSQLPIIDHYLVARAQRCATGANAHDVYSLLGTYYGMCELANADPACFERFAAIEQRLRRFCLTGRLGVAAAASRVC